MVYVETRKLIDNEHFVMENTNEYSFIMTANNNTECIVRLINRFLEQILCFDRIKITFSKYEVHVQISHNKDRVVFTRLLKYMINVDDSVDVHAIENFCNYILQNLLYK